MIRTILLEMLSAAVVLVPVFLILWKVMLHDFKTTVCYAIFSVYLSAVYFLVGLPTVRFSAFELNLNLIPFAGMLADLKNEIKNVLLFIPLGFLLPFLWERYRKWQSVLLFGFGTSLTVEVLQIFTYRATDVNDILTNTLGTMIGCLLFRAVEKVVPGLGEKKDQVWLIVLIVAAVMYFVQPNIVAFIYRII